MRKIVRILGLIQLIRNKNHYSGFVRRSLIRTLLFLEYKSFLQPHYNQPVVVPILHYKVHAYGYANLCVLFREIFVEEEYQYFQSTEDQPVIIDCGANIGLATLYLKWKFPNAVIHAFEPDPSAFELLQKNVQSNQLSNVHINNQAAMDQPGAIRFYRSPQTTASLMMSTVKGRLTEESIDVLAIDFPQFVKQSGVRYLKIDIEGAETPVFERMHTATGFGELHQIIMEYHHKIEGHPSALARMLQILEEQNFEYNLITKFESPGQFQDVLIYACKSE